MSEMNINEANPIVKISKMAFQLIPKVHIPKLVSMADKTDIEMVAKLFE